MQQQHIVNRLERLKANYLQKGARQENRAIATLPTHKHYRKPVPSCVECLVEFVQQPLKVRSVCQAHLHIHMQWLNLDKQPSINLCISSSHQYAASPSSSNPQKLLISDRGDHRAPCSSRQQRLPCLFAHNRLLIISFTDLCSDTSCHSCTHPHQHPHLRVQ